MASSRPAVSSKTTAVPPNPGISATPTTSPNQAYASAPSGASNTTGIPLVPPPTAAGPENSNLIQYVKRSVRNDEDFHFLRFESLQRTNIVALQLKLIRTKDKILTNEDLSHADVETLRETLEQYATALQNYDYLRNKRSLTKDDAEGREMLLKRYFLSGVKHSEAFNSHYSYFTETETKVDALRTTLMRVLPARMTYSQNERISRKAEYRSGKPPKEISAFLDGLVRFLVATLGGLFLVGPMLIMAIHPSRNKSLITVSAAVFLFIAVLSFGVKVNNVEALVSTATYAAVLVVFVGTSTGET